MTTLNFATITDHLLSDLIELIVAMSIQFSFVASCSIECTVTFCSLLLLHFKVVSLLIDLVHFPTYQTLLIWVVRTTVTTMLLCSCIFSTYFVLDFCYTLSAFIVLKSLISLKLSKVTVCNNWALNHLAHANICSLVTVLVFVMVVSLYIISVNISLSFNP